MHQFGFENMGRQKVIGNLYFIRLNQEGVFLVNTLMFHAIWYHQSTEEYLKDLTSNRL